MCSVFFPSQNYGRKDSTEHGRREKNKTFQAYLVELLSHVRLCDIMACSPPGFSVHEVSQARILEWVAISFSRGVFLTQGLDWCPRIGRQILFH